MQVFEHASQFEPRGRAVCVAIGMFDGVHLGHQQVLRQTIEDARRHDGVAVAVTFDRHPCSVVAPDRCPPLLYSLPQKLRAIEATGMDAAWLIPFDVAWSRVPAAEFIRGMARDFAGLRSLSVGGTFTFGHRRGGNVQVLRALGGELGFDVHGLASVALDGKVVSSTRIRESVRLGELDVASQMLGRTYSVAGEVVRGSLVGRELGFPTANLDTTGRMLPPNGVYAVHACAGGHRYHAVANVGVRPSVESEPATPRLEVHLIDVDPDLYGAEMEVAFVRHLRDERRFPSRDELAAQIARDIERARTSF